MKTNDRPKLARQAARPRAKSAKPSYPRVLGIGAVALLAAACGGSVDVGDGSGPTNSGPAGTSQGAFGAGGSNEGGVPNWGGGPSGVAAGGWDVGGAGGEATGGTGGAGAAAGAGGENWGGGLSGDSQEPFGGYPAS